MTFICLECSWTGDESELVPSPDEAGCPLCDGDVVVLTEAREKL